MGSGAEGKDTDLHLPLLQEHGQGLHPGAGGAGQNPPLVFPNDLHVFLEIKIAVLFLSEKSDAFIQGACNFHQDGYTIGDPDYLTDVGEFENSDSAYGTFDQGGNLWEWNETLIGGAPCVRGSSFNDSSDELASFYRNGLSQAGEYNSVGFRVASVPEPSTMCFLSLGGLALLRKGK